MDGKTLEQGHKIHSQTHTTTALTSSSVWRSSFHDSSALCPQKSAEQMRFEAALARYTHS